MKILKRLAPMLLSLLIILTMLPTAAMAVGGPTASGSCSLSFKNSDGSATTATYSAYKIASFDITEDPNSTTTPKTYFYTGADVVDDYAATLKTKLGVTSDIDQDIISALSSTTDAATISEIAYALKGVVTSATPAITAAGVSNASGVITGLDYGYYLVLETKASTDGYVASEPILVCLPDTTGNGAIDVSLKNSVATIEKKIVETDPADNTKKIYVDSSTAKIGDTIDYQSVSTIPYYSMLSTAVEYYITDTFSTGLTFNYSTSDTSKLAAAIVDVNGNTIAALSNGTDYTVDATTGGFKLTLTTSETDVGDTTYLSRFLGWGAAGYRLKVTYSATLNSSAQVGTTGNPNSVKLTYGNKSGVYSTPDDTVITYTAKLVITKTDGATNAKLKDAEFTLYKDSGNRDNDGKVIWDTVETVKTDSNGEAVFTKLEQGTYKLAETKAPDGYSLAEDVIFTVSAQNGSTSIPSASINVTQIGNDAALAFKATWLSDNNDIAVNGDTGIMSVGIKDDAGFTLPGTGGNGTTIFTVAGISIILLGSCMLFVYHKKNKASEQG